MIHKSSKTAANNVKKKTQPKNYIKQLKPKNNINNLNNRYNNDSSTSNPKNIANQLSLDKFNSIMTTNKGYKGYSKLFITSDNNNKITKIKNKRTYNSRDKVLKANSLVSKMKSKKEFVSNNLKEKQNLYFNEDYKLKNKSIPKYPEQNFHIKSTDFMEIDEQNETIISDEDENNSNNEEDKLEEELMNNTVTIKDELINYDNNNSSYSIEKKTIKNDIILEEQEPRLLSESNINSNCINKEIKTQMSFNKNNNNMNDSINDNDLINKLERNTNFQKKEKNNDTETINSAILKNLTTDNKNLNYENYMNNVQNISNNLKNKNDTSLITYFRDFLFKNSDSSINRINNKSITKNHKISYLNKSNSNNKKNEKRSDTKEKIIKNCNTNMTNNITNNKYTKNINNINTKNNMNELKMNCTIGNLNNENLNNSGNHNNSKIISNNFTNNNNLNCSKIKNSNGNQYINFKKNISNYNLGRNDSQKNEIIISQKEKETQLSNQSILNIKEIEKNNINDCNIKKIYSVIKAHIPNINSKIKSNKSPVNIEISKINISNNNNYISIKSKRIPSPNERGRDKKNQMKKISSTKLKSKGNNKDENNNVDCSSINISQFPRINNVITIINYNDIKISNNNNNQIISNSSNEKTKSNSNNIILENNSSNKILNERKTINNNPNQEKEEQHSITTNIYINNNTNLKANQCHKILPIKKTSNNKNKNYIKKELFIKKQNSNKNIHENKSNNNINIEIDYLQSERKYNYNTPTPNNNNDYDVIINNNINTHVANNNILIPIHKSPKICKKDNNNKIKIKNNVNSNNSSKDEIIQNDSNDNNSKENLPFTITDKISFIHPNNNNFPEEKKKINTYGNNNNNQKNIHHQKNQEMIHPKKLFNSFNKNDSPNLNNINDTSPNNVMKNSTKKVNLHLYKNNQNIDNITVEKQNFVKKIKTKNKKNTDNDFIKKASTAMSSGRAEINNNLEPNSNKSTTMFEFDFTRKSYDGPEIHKNKIKPMIYNNLNSNNNYSNSNMISNLNTCNNNFNNDILIEDNFTELQIPIVADENPTIISLKTIKYNKCTYTNHCISFNLLKIFNLSQIKEKILSFLDGNDLFYLSLVNKFYNETTGKKVHNIVIKKILTNAKNIISKLWGELLHQSILYKNNSNLQKTYEKYLNLANKYDEDIIKDLSRTLPNSNLFKKESTNYNKLFNILKAYSNYNKKIGYAQGMNFIVAKLIVLFKNEKDAFINLDSLFKKLNFCDVIGISNGLEQKMFIIEYLLKKFCPKIIRFFNDMKINHEMFTVSWVITLFSKNLENDRILLNIWNFSIIYGWKFIYLFTVSVLINYRNKYIGLELYEFTQFMKNIFKNDDFKKDFSKILRMTFDYMSQWKNINKELSKKYKVSVKKLDEESVTDIIMNSHDECIIP